MTEEKQQSSRPKYARVVCGTTGRSRRTRQEKGGGDRRQDAGFTASETRRR